MLSFMYTGFLCLFLNMFKCSTLLNNVKVETDEIYLLCPSDIYSMIFSLQTGMNKNILDPYQTAPKREWSLIEYS